MPVQINVQANQTALAQSIAQGVSQYNSRLAGKNKINLKINERQFRQPLGRITSDLNDFESAMKASNARVLAFGASTAVLGGVVKAFKDVADATLQVEKNLADINRILNLSVGSLQKFSTQLFDISRNTATSFDQVSKAALEFSRQGLSFNEVLNRTGDALTLVRLTGIDAGKAVADLTAAVNGFAREGLNTSEILNKVVAVEQKFAVSARDITEALSRAGQSALEAGADFNQLNALVATAQQTTARGGSVIGNALKTIFTRLQRGETLNQLENFNIQVRDLQGNILPAVQILQNFSAAYGGLAQTQKAYLSEQVAGVYQVNILKALVNDLNKEYGIYNSALRVATGATNEADKANEKLNKTLNALLSQTSASLTQLGSTLGESTFKPIAKSIIEPINEAVQYINGLLEGEGLGSNFARGLLEGIKNILSGPALVGIFAVLAQVAKNTFIDLTRALPALLGLSSASQKRATIEKSILNILQGQGDVAKALMGQGNSRATQADTLLKLARNTTSEYRSQLATAKELAAILSRQNVSVGARGLQTGRKFKSEGYIPPQIAQAEIGGAMAGGYMPGAVVKSPVGGVMNTAENVKYVAGFNQPFINPPAGSKAGRKHRSSSMSRTGVDPYASFGFIPNFALPRDYYKVDGSLNNPKITSAVNSKKISEQDAKAAGWTTSRDKKAAAAETARSYNLKREASMLVPDTDFFDASAKKKFQSGFQLGGEKYDSVDFSIHGLKRGASKNLKNKNSTIAEVIDDSLHTAGKTLLKSFDPAFIKGARISKAEIEGLVDQAGGKGARESLKGAFFEGIIRKLISSKKAGESLNPESGTLDTKITPEIKDLFEGNIASGQGDFKANKGTKLRGAFASQVLRNLGAKILSTDDSKSQTKRKGKFGGFIPNFAYKNAVMSLEENMSGKKSVFSNSPIPHIRNSGQGSFASAVADHGGLQQAVKDSYAAQSSAGLVNSGYIPNFAPIPKISSKDVFGKKFADLTRQQQQELQKLNRALRTLSSEVNLSANDQKLLQGDVRTYAKQLEATTGSTLVVQKANQSVAIATNRLATERNVVATQTSAYVPPSTLPASMGSYVPPSTLNPGGFSSKPSLLGRAGAGIRGVGQRIGGLSTRFQNARQTAFDAQAKRGGSGLGLGLSFAAPILGGMASSFIERGRSRIEMSEEERFNSAAASSVPTAAVTGAMIGSSIFPGLGTAIGGVVGALAGLASAASEAATNLDDIRSQAQKDRDQEQGVIAKLTSMGEINEKLQGTATNAKQRRELISQRTELFQELPKGSREILGVTGANDSEKLNEEIERLKKETAKNEYVRIANELQTSKSLDKEGKRLAYLNLARYAEEDATVKKLLDSLIKNKDDSEALNEIVQSSDFKEFPEGLQKAVLKTLVPPETGGGSYIKKALELSTASLPEMRRLAMEEKAGPIDVRGNLGLLEEQVKLVEQTEDAAIKGASEVVPGVANIFNQILENLRDINLGVDKELIQLDKSKDLREIGFKANQALTQGIISPIDSIAQQGTFRKTELQADFDKTSKEINNDFLNAFVTASKNKIKSAEVALELKDLVSEKAGIKELDKFFDKIKDTENVLVDPKERIVLESLAKEAVNREITRKAALKAQQDVIDADITALSKRAEVTEKEQENLNTLSNLLAKREMAIQDLQLQSALNTSDRNLKLQSPGAFNRMTLQEEDQFRSKLRRDAASEQRNIFTQTNIAGNVDSTALEANLDALGTAGIGAGAVVSNPEYFVELKKNEEAIANISKEANKENLRALIERQEAIRDTAKEMGLSGKAIKDQEDTINSLLMLEEQILGFEKQQTKELENQNTLADRQREARTTAKGGYEKAIKQIRTEAETFPSRFAENTTIAFRDGLVNAMDAAINRTDDLESALLGVASSFLQSIQSALMGQVANQIVGALPMSKQRGGLIRAQNGMYISGGRTGDKNPALLEDGEYVLNREAVKGMGGPKALDGINYGTFPRFASGGRLKSGERRLSEDVALGSMMSAEGSDASARVNLSATSDQLSAFAQENTVFIKEYYQQRKQLDAIRRQKRAEKKAKKRQMIAQAISSFAMAGVSAGIGAIGNAGNSAGSTSMGKFLESGPGGTSVNPNSQAGLGFDAINSPFQYNVGLPYNKGGYVPYGSRITDSVPAMLTGGEYVVNSNAVRKYGVGGLNSINSGIARFQDGGMVSDGGAGGGMTETNTNTSSTNNVSVNITVNAKGGNSSEETNTNEEGSAPQTQAEKYEDFSKKVKQVVMQVINTEQRSGGLLDSTKKKQQ